MNTPPHAADASQATNKPKLVFFQFKYDTNLPAFLLAHKAEHVTCLAQFFDVVVVNRDCDYQQICEEHQPELVLFESGVNHPTCQRLQISNIRSCAQIPKAGLHHGDAFCNARSGFLSDMDHWGIDTFFAISTTAAEHTPEIADQLLVWPVFVNSQTFHDYGGRKSIPVLITGNRNELYPWRKSITKRIAKHFPSLNCPHPGYQPNQAPLYPLVGEEYARTINASWFVPACGTVAREVVRKHFEVPASKACLIAEESASLKAAGFIDMTNCVFADERNVVDKLDYLFRHRDQLTQIIEAGHQLVRSRHTLEHRDQIYQWFRLSQSLQPGERIVQTGPFEPLRVVQSTSDLRTSHVHSNGLHLRLLREGDQKFSEGKYDEAASRYLRCASYMPWMPEPKLRMALCELQQGHALRAQSWIEGPIQFSLRVYRAVDPDPVEWAYYVVSWLCLGNVEMAAKLAEEFAWLRHPELDHVRWATSVLKNRGLATASPANGFGNRRLSIHQLPVQSREQWLGQLCSMLKACRQFGFAEILAQRHSHRSPVGGETGRNANTARTPQATNGNSDSSGRGPGLAPGPYKDVARNHNQFFAGLRGAAKARIRPVLHRLEGWFGYFLPYHLSSSRNDACFEAIQESLREGDFHSALLVGAAPGKGCTEALIAGAMENGDRPSAFCVSQGTRGAGYSSLVRWYELESRVPVSLADQLGGLVKQIAKENGIEWFDVVVVDASAFTQEADILRPLEAELHAARVVFLHGINNVASHRVYDGLLRDPNYILADQNPMLRDGYAIFERQEGTDLTGIQQVDNAMTEVVVADGHHAQGTLAVQNR